ncbi:MAG: OmpA family protein [Pseudomonadota bacterium]
MKLQNKRSEEGHWISVSDLMAGLMIVFLFIAISYMIKVKEVATTYTKIQNEIYEALAKEFKNDLPKWKAIIDEDTLSIRFKEPDILFDRGKCDVNNKFQNILKDFFPRYIRVVTKDKFKKEIDEIRVEGHTSSPGLKNQDENEAYFYNMKLSQDRTRSVLKYVLNLDEIDNKKAWLKKHLTANGLSSSKVIYNEENIEDRTLSRRVEFRVKTNAEKRIKKIASRSL